MKIELPALVNSVLAKKKKRQHTLLFSLKKGTLFLGKGHLSAREQTVFAHRRSQGHFLVSPVQDSENIFAPDVESYCQSPRAKGLAWHKAIFVCVFMIPNHTHTLYFCPLTHPFGTPAKVWEHGRTEVSWEVMTREQNPDDGVGETKTNKQWSWRSTI